MGWCDQRNCQRKRGYSVRGMTPQDYCILVRGTGYSAIPVMTVDGIYDVRKCKWHEVGRLCKKLSPASLTAL